MATQPSAGSPSPTPAPAPAGTRMWRGLVGYLIGCTTGGLAGWLIDRAVTDDPYAGIRIGIFLGGLLGAVIGSGGGWPGVVLMLSMVVVSAAGAVAAFLLFKPDPSSFLMVLPIAIGGMVGAFLGLALGALLLHSLRKVPAPPA